MYLTMLQGELNTSHVRQNCSPNWESAKGPSYKEILGQLDTQDEPSTTKEK